MKKLIIILLSLGALKAQAQKQETLLGKTDFYALLGAAPVLQSTPESAFQYTCGRDINCQGNYQLEQDYNNFKRKVELYENQFKAALETKYNAVKKDEETLYADTKNQLNQDPMIQQMGGVDNITNMTEAQRKQAALNAAAVNAASAQFSPFTQAEMQRMMTDPEYARQMTEKFNKMTDKEKEAFVKSKLAAQPVQVSNQEFEQSMAKGQNTKNLIAINLFVAEINTKLSAAANAYGNKVNAMRGSSGSHNDLDAAYKTEYDKIPLVVMGEGKEPDPMKLKALNISFALKHKKRAAQELATVQSALKNMQSVINECIEAYHTYLQENGYRINTDMGDIYNGTNTEVALAQAEGFISESIEYIGRTSYYENKQASGYEQHYQLIIQSK